MKTAALKGVEPWGGKDASGPPTQAQDIQDIAAFIIAQNLVAPGLRPYSPGDLAKSTIAWVTIAQAKPTRTMTPNFPCSAAPRSSTHRISHVTSRTPAK